MTLLDDDTRYVYCLNTDCSCDGVPAGEVALQDQPGRGLPRPVLEGRPVPWLAPVIGDRVAWTALNDQRVLEAQRSWLCQVCGEPLTNADAWVAVSAGDVAAGGAMHRRCLALARKVCPVLSTDLSYVYVQVRRGDDERDWAVVFERLSDYEARHGTIPVSLEYESES
ncbi:hypothetical protein CFP71_13450 [Amycolatopsis thailandensis]|uniref:Uncharacterized protein n=1 Tax=Amycolatopsis thailandensis TaxID=589330 RepID=A0A229SBZ9_9PSEU|nr:hypothetical protein [Amycolatopsis thailandensis]OXM56428.1 hypothetical protein CFP71_13450 [Amycolatopsis thailandensis]